MNVMVREISKIIPGKMAEAMELYKKEMVAWNRLGLNPVVKLLRPFAREGDRMQTIVWEAEFDSLTTIEANMKKVMADPEIQEIVAKWQAITDSNVIELYMVED